MPAIDVVVEFIVDVVIQLNIDVAVTLRYIDVVPVPVVVALTDAHDNYDN